MGRAIAVRTDVDRDSVVEARIAERIIELAEAGERNPDILCERVLYEFGKLDF